MSVIVEERKEVCEQEIAEEEVGAARTVEREVKELSRMLNSVISQFSSILVGRERTIRLNILALMTGHHIYMISKPGTAKTMMADIGETFGLKTFYYLYSYDTKLEDILYDIVLKKKKAKNEMTISVDYVLKDPGLGTCDIHFADEMFKAPSEVLNALLGAMNERKVTLGNRVYKIPLRTLVAASNEVPADPSTAALIDRFLFRDFLDYLPEDLWSPYLVTYWNIHQPSFAVQKITAPRELLDKAQRYIWKVDIYGVLGNYVKLLAKLKDKGIELSDRRKGWVLRSIAASALLAGRLEAKPEDLDVLLYTAPATREQKDVVAEVLNDFFSGLEGVKEELSKISNRLSAVELKLKQMSETELVRLLGEELPEFKNYLTQVGFESLKNRLDKIREKISSIEEQAIEVLAKRLLYE